MDSENRNSTSSKHIRKRLMGWIAGKAKSSGKQTKNSGEGYENTVKGLHAHPPNVYILTTGDIVSICFAAFFMGLGVGYIIYLLST